MPRTTTKQPVTPRRLFLLGAGFSAAVKMPVSVQVPELLAEADDYLRHGTSMDDWRRGAAAVFQLRRPTDMDVEMLFETMYLERELMAMWAQFNAFDFRDLSEHVGARTVETAITVCYENFMELLRTRGEQADIAPLMQWAKSVKRSDYIVTLNYDIVCERLLAAASRPFSLAAVPVKTPRTRLLKLHGSVDWIRVPHGRRLRKGCSVLFDPYKHINRGRGPANPPGKEDAMKPEHFRIVRCPSLPAIRSIIRDYFPTTSNFAVVGFSRTKEPGRVTGLGAMWHSAAFGLYHCEEVIAIGFALSRFDVLMRHFIADVMHARRAAGKPDPKLRIVDPNFATIRESYQHVFGIKPEQIGDRAESVDWTAI